MDGWFSVARKLLDDPMWTKEPFTRGQAWIDLVGLANYKPGYIRVRGNRIDIDRGQVGWSVAALADRWKWSRGKVGRFLDELERDQQVEQQKSNISCVITITNYEHYQQNGQQNGTKPRDVPLVSKWVSPCEENGQQNGQQKSDASSLTGSTCDSTGHQNGQQNGQQTSSRRAADGH